jgi:hypothetical protein
VLEQQQIALMYRPSWWYYDYSTYGMHRAYLGRGQSAADSTFHGKIHEFAIYDKYIPKSSLEYLAEDSLSTFAAYVPPDQHLTNVAFQKPAEVSTGGNDVTYANMATNGHVDWPTTFSSGYDEAWWEVDLASGSSSKTYSVHWITLLNRVDHSSYTSRLVPMDMTLMDSNRNVLHTITETKTQYEYNYFFDSEFKGSTGGLKCQGL